HFLTTGGDGGGGFGGGGPASESTEGESGGGGGGSWAAANTTTDSSAPSSRPSSPNNSDGAVRISYASRTRSRVDAVFSCSETAASDGTEETVCTLTSGTVVDLNAVLGLSPVTEDESTPIWIQAWGAAGGSGNGSGAFSGGSGGSGGFAQVITS